MWPPPAVGAPGGASLDVPGRSMHACRRPWGFDGWATTTTTQGCWRGARRPPMPNGRARDISSITHHPHHPSSSPSARSHIPHGPQAAASRFRQCVCGWFSGALRLQSPDNPFKNPDKVVCHIVLVCPPADDDTSIRATAEVLSSLPVSHCAAGGCYPHHHHPSVQRASACAGVLPP